MTSGDLHVDQDLVGVAADSLVVGVVLFRLHALLEERVPELLGAHVPDSAPVFAEAKNAVSP